MCQMLRVLNQVRNISIGIPLTYTQYPFYSNQRTIWATSWENLYFEGANNTDADQTAQMCNLISVFVFLCMTKMIPQKKIVCILSLEPLNGFRLNFD